MQRQVYRYFEDVIVVIILLDNHMMNIQTCVLLCLLQALLAGSFIINQWSYIRTGVFKSVYNEKYSHRIPPLFETVEGLTTDEDVTVDAASINQNNKVSMPRVTWNAATSSSVRVKESKRTVEQYMALPASQYSVLTADQITRISESEFKCTLGTMNFFGTKFTPTLYVNVDVFPDDARAEIVVSRAEVSGSEAAATVNGTFSISAVNKVTAGVDKKGFKTLNSNTTLVIDAIVPSTRLPLGLIRRGGNFLMQSTLSVVVPTFVRILASDFKRWSAGDDSRSALEGVRLDAPAEVVLEDE